MLAATTGLWKALGNLETRLLGAQLDDVAIDRPVFISGVARSGSTILTEVISRHPQTTSHRYSDFPLTWTPYWWNSLRRELPLPRQEPKERAHRDRLLITAESPEAVDEVLWMHFFPGAHRRDDTHVLTGQASHPVFENYYRNHVRKLLAARKRQRYVAKNNYHATRLEYLLSLFPDARFVIPVREPVQHVGSLVKQHRLFSRQHQEDRRVSRQLQMAGHYEFGPLRCPIIVDVGRQADYGEQADDIDWYAQQWADVYGFLQQRMAANPALAEACLVVRYEDLCAETRHCLKNLFTHLGLDDAASEAIVETFVPLISAPDYYEHGFGAAEETRIHDATRKAAAGFGYRDAPAAGHKPAI